MAATTWVARLGSDDRTVLCRSCGGVLGKIWEMAGDRHFVFPNSMAPNESGVWAMTRRARRAARFGQPAYRRPLPVGLSLSPNKNPFESIALEPKTYPVAAECPRCGLAQGIDADQIDVVVPDPDDNADPYITWPLSDPFESIGAPDDD